LDQAQALIQFEDLLLRELRGGIDQGHLNVLEHADCPEWLRNLAVRLRGPDSHSKVTLRDMAEWTGYSPSYLRAQFIKNFGLSPNQYLLRVRMREARRLLRSDRKWSIAETAKRVGYASPSQFSQDFRRATGMTPRQWRAAGPARPKDR
jgi:AraC-like DNA-binding protein